jgi:uncharacterized protein involved in exopolysaccharide biosynthesis
VYRGKIESERYGNPGDDIAEIPEAVEVRIPLGSPKLPWSLRIGLAGIGFLVGPLIPMTASKLQPASYYASACIEITHPDLMSWSPLEHQPTKVIRGHALEREVRQAVAILKSREILRTLAENLNLAKEWEAKTPAEIIERLSNKIVIERIVDSALGCSKRQKNGGLRLLQYLRLIYFTDILT